MKKPPRAKLHEVVKVQGGLFPYGKEQIGTVNEGGTVRSL